MKKTFGLLSVVLAVSSLGAQTVTNPPAAVPIEATSPAPAATETTNAVGDVAAKTPASKKSATTKRSAKKPLANKKFAELKSVPLSPGPAVVAVSNLNVRGQAKLNSEVVAHLTKDQVVTVLEEITLKHSAPDEPSAWAKIALPAGARIWVNTNYLDANRTVAARKLNLRAGPGENYSVLGLLLRGDSLKEIGAKGDWIEIEPPAKAYAFVAAQYLRQLPPETASAPPVVAAAPQSTPPPPPVTEAPKSTPPPNETPVTAPPPAATVPAFVAAPNTTIVIGPPSPATEPAASAAERPPRIVQREGMLRGTVSIQAPSHFELISLENKKTVDYLYSPSDDLDLRRWKGLHVIVTGEEGLDERWPNTPVLTIHKIEVLDEP